MKSSLFDIFKLSIYTLFIFLGGCSLDDAKKKYSEDIEGLRAIIPIPSEVTSVRWEIFNSPEYPPLPSSADFVALVAELDIKNNYWPSKHSEEPQVGYLVPQAAREWLSDDFKLLMSKNQNGRVDISKLGDCVPYKTELIKSKETIEGLVCKKTGKALLYLVIKSYS